MTTKIEIPKGKHLRVVSKKAGFRRGGLAHPDTPVLHDPATLTGDQIAAILGEPVLIADWVDPPEEKKSGAGGKGQAKDKTNTGGNGGGGADGGAGANQNPPS